MKGSKRQRKKKMGRNGWIIQSLGYAFKKAGRAAKAFAKAVRGLGDWQE